MANYVKFQRGTITAYENLKSRGGIDNNTLYFIYSQDEPNKGILYMGEKIISSGDITIGVERLSELKDVSLNGLSDKVILQYNAINQKWQVIDFKTAAEEAGIGGGAIEIKKIELLDGETVAQALARVFPEPKSGNMGIINNIIYFYDGEQWRILNPAPSSDFITSVDENTFQVIDGNLSLKALNPQLLVPVVGDLDELDSHKQGENTTIVDEINNINARLKWQEFEGENE